MYAQGPTLLREGSQTSGGSQIIQSYEHYAYGHGDLRGPNYRHLDLVTIF